MEISEYKTMILAIIRKYGTAPIMKINADLDLVRRTDIGADEKISTALQELMAEDAIHNPNPSNNRFFKFGKAPSDPSNNNP